MRRTLLALDFRSGCTGTIDSEHFVREVLELQLAEHFQHLVLVRWIEVQRIVIKFHRCIDVDRCEHLAHAPLLGERDHVLLLLPFQLVRVLDHTFQAAELLHQLHCRLLADARNTGNVVHRIAHQPEYVLHLIGVLQSPARADLRRPELLRRIATTTGFVHDDLVRDELPEILVRRNHERGVAFRFGLFRQRADHIISLVAIALEDGDVHALDDAPDVREIGADIIGHLLPVRLVIEQCFVSFGRCSSVEHHGDVCGLLAPDQIEQGGGETERRARVEALAIDPRCPDETEVRAVDQREGVEEEEAFVVRRRRGHGGVGGNVRAG